MNSFVDTPTFLTGVSLKPEMTAQDIMAFAQAGQDWKDGVAPDQNPYPKGTTERRYYQEEFERLLIEEQKLEQLEGLCQEES